MKSKKLINLEKIDKVWVSHGKTTHPLGQKCKVCEKTLREWEKAKKTGKIDKLLKESE